MDILKIASEASSIFAVLGVFILWLFSRNFVSKEEFKKERKGLEQELKAEFNQFYNELKAENKAIYGDLNKQKVNMAELNTKMDNLIKAVDNLNGSANDIKEFLINRSIKKAK